MRLQWFTSLIFKSFISQIVIIITQHISPNMLPYYLLENYTPFLCYLPTFYPLTDCQNQPIYTPFSPTDLTPHAQQPKTAHRTSSEIPKCKRREQQMGQFFSKQEQNLDKRESKQPPKRSIVDSIELQNRNILPNMTNVILSYVRRVNKSGKQVKRVLQALKTQDLQCAIKKFYAYQNFLKNNVNDFIIRNGIKALMDRLDPNCPCFPLSEQIEYNKVFRIVILRYLEKDYLEFILTSKKMDQPKRRDHLKVRRYLIETLNQVPTEDSESIL